MTQSLPPPEVAAREALGELSSPGQLAEHLGVPKATVYSWSTTGTGPRRIRVGKHVRYRRADVDAWLDQHAETTGTAA